MTLQNFFEENPEGAVAFSGGVDSVYLLAMAVRFGKRITAYYVKTAFQPEFERQDAIRAAEEIGAELRILSCEILDRPEVTANPADRCYHCKRQIFSEILKAAKEDGYSLVLDGTNASDEAGDRPGMRALGEMGVCSPLQECGLTKAMIREESRKCGLFTWDKPAYACLATRIPTGMEITASLLARVEDSEEKLFRMGFSDFRARVLDGALKLQFTEEDLPEAFARRKELVEHLKGGGFEVLLDLTPRKRGA